MFRLNHIKTCSIGSIIKTLFALLILPILVSCENNETIPDKEDEKFYIEFMVDGNRKVNVSQLVDSTVQLYPSVSLTTSKDSNYPIKVEHSSDLGNYQRIRLSFSTYTNNYSWDIKNNPYYSFFRNSLISNQVTFYPSVAYNNLAVYLEYYDIVTEKWYRSVKLRNINGTISPVDGGQQNSNFVITRHIKHKPSNPIWAPAEAELIEGTFNMKLHSSQEDSIMVTNGKFKVYLVL